jgi:hypothetical protein
LAQELGVEGADEEGLYAALDWLLERQERIEKKLAARHLSEGGQVLYDVSSSYYVGASVKVVQNSRRKTGPIGARGYG